MLNIITRISLSRSSKALIRTYARNNPLPFTAMTWGRVDAFVKNEISKKLLYNQDSKCVYCERYLHGLSPQMDHFVPKAHYPEFTFTTSNLFYACGPCNSSDRKGHKKVMLHPDPIYRDCTFRIIHPLFDNPDTEIIFQDANKIYLDYEASTQLGRNTIDFFRFDDIVMTSIRSRQLMFERLNPMPTSEQRALINEIITYKK